MPPVDLARERRIRGTLDELRALLTDNPDLAVRTDAMLAGELCCPELLGVNMAATDRHPTSLRLHPDMLERADLLRSLMEEDPEYKAIGRGVSRALVLRVAVLRGLEALEKKYGGAKKK